MWDFVAKLSEHLQKKTRFNAVTLTVLQGIHLFLFIIHVKPKWNVSYFFCTPEINADMYTLYLRIWCNFQCRTRHKIFLRKILYSSRVVRHFSENYIKNFIIIGIIMSILISLFRTEINIFTNIDDMPYNIG